MLTANHSVSDTEYTELVEWLWQGKNWNTQR